MADRNAGRRAETGAAPAGAAAPAPHPAQMAAAAMMMPLAFAAAAAPLVAASPFFWAPPLWVLSLMAPRK